MRFVIYVDGLGTCFGENVAQSRRERTRAEQLGHAFSNRTVKVKAVEIWSVETASEQISCRGDDRLSLIYAGVDVVVHEFEYLSHR